MTDDRLLLNQQLNGGVALGDREAHAAAAHLAQPLYCLGYAAAALAPTLLLGRPAASIRGAWALLSADGGFGVGCCGDGGGGGGEGQGAGGGGRRGASAAAAHIALRFGLRFGALTAAAALAVRYGTIAHPYLLADNRHYTFYLWKVRGEEGSFLTQGGALLPFFSHCIYVYFFAFCFSHNFSPSP